MIPSVVIALVFALCFGFAESAKASAITKQNLTYLVNQARIENGLQPLKSDAHLTMAATLKSKDMIQRDYFEHYAFGLTPWNFMNYSGYDYMYAGENLAINFDTAEGTVAAWLDSPSHRANLLNEDYEDIGISVEKGEFTNADGKTEETIVVTNMFGRKKPIIVEVFNNLLEAISRIF